MLSPRSLAAGLIGTRAAEFGQRLRMQGGAVVGKAAEDDPGSRAGAASQRSTVAETAIRAARSAGNDRCRWRWRETQPKRGRALAQLDGAGVAGGQRVVLALVAAIPDRADGMDHMPRRQPITSGDLGAAGLAAIERAAFGEKLRPGRAMDRAIDAAAAEQRRLAALTMASTRKVVMSATMTSSRAGPIWRARQTQAEAAALTVTPLSANSCCNSPAWNISRMMSQPPTNSPLT